MEEEKEYGRDDEEGVYSGTSFIGIHQRTSDNWNSYNSNSLVLLVNDFSFSRMVVRVCTSGIIDRSSFNRVSAKISFQ